MISQNNAKYKSGHEQMFVPAKSYSKNVNYLPLTTSLNFLPAENTGTVFAGILIALPV